MPFSNVPFSYDSPQCTTHFEHAGSEQYSDMGEEKSGEPQWYWLLALRYHQKGASRTFQKDRNELREWEEFWGGFLTSQSL